MIDPWMLLLGQAVIGSGLIISYGILYVQLRRTQRQLAEERLAVLKEVRRTADALMEETKRIAKAVFEETQSRTSADATNLGHKMDTILRQFDVIDHKQGEVVVTVHDTHDVVQRELTNGTDNTIRHQIDRIEESTAEMKRRLEDKS